MEGEIKTDSENVSFGQAYGKFLKQISPQVVVVKGTLQILYIKKVPSFDIEDCDFFLVILYKPENDIFIHKYKNNKIIAIKHIETSACNHMSRLCLCKSRGLKERNWLDQVPYVYRNHVNDLLNV